MLNRIFRWVFIVETALSIAVVLFLMLLEVLIVTRDSGVPQGQHIVYVLLIDNVQF
jgi:hypothetical protein